MHSNDRNGGRYHRYMYVVPTVSVRRTRRVRTSTNIPCRRIPVRVASSRLPSPPSVALSLTGQSEAERSSVAHRRWLLEAGCSLTDARHEASGGGVEVEGTGADDRFPTGADVWRRLPVEKCELIACAVERNPICMDRGAQARRGESGEGDGEGREPD